MRNLKYFSFGIISLIFASCIEEKNLSTQNEEDLENAELGLSTDFSLKTERSISITATDGEGKTQKGVKMGIFASQPYRFFFNLVEPDRLIHQINSLLP